MKRKNVKQKKLLIISIISLSVLSLLTSCDPSACDCIKNNQKAGTSDYDSKLKKRCDNKMNSMDNDEVTQWWAKGANCK